MRSVALAASGVAAVLACAATPVVADARRMLGDASFQGSTAVLPLVFQPELIYKKFPSDTPVAPDEPWRLGFGMQLDSMAASIDATLSLDPHTNQQIQILDGRASLVQQGGLYNNYGPKERFELVYTGREDPFIGPIDLVLSPAGFDEVPVRVHVNAIDQPGFPLPLLASTAGVPGVGDITGDGLLEIIVPGTLQGVAGLHAFAADATALSGWPLRENDPDIIDQSFGTPAIMDLDGDGAQEVIVVGFAIHAVARDAADGNRGGEAPGPSHAGTRTVTTLYAVQGDGAVRWQTSQGEFHGIPAVADIDGDADLDIVVGAGTNLKRYEADGTPMSAWQVQSPNDVHVTAPALCDVDDDPRNGLEVVACTPVPGPDAVGQVYVWNEDGTLHGAAWPVELDACLPPAVVELDGDAANGREIVMAIDHEPTPPVDPKTGLVNTFSVYAWHADGSDARGWPFHMMRDTEAELIDDRVVAPCSAGDVDGDGDVEVVVGTYGQGAAANGNLFLFHHDGTLDADWPRWAGIAQTPSVWGGTALADLDTDGWLDVVTGSVRGVYAFSRDGQPFPGFPKLTADVFAQPIVADLDADGRLEIVQTSVFDQLYVWQLLTPSATRSPWPRYRHNARRTGAYEGDQGPAVPTATEVGMVALFCMLAGASALIMRRRTAWLTS